MLGKQEASAYEVQGHPVRCPHCGHGRFWTRKTLMNTPGMSIFGLDWANREAINYVCEECGHVQWFLKRR